MHVDAAVPDEGLYLVSTSRPGVGKPCKSHRRTVPVREENMLDDPPFTSRHQKAEARRREVREELCGMSGRFLINKYIFMSLEAIASPLSDARRGSTEAWTRKATPRSSSR